MFFKRLTKTKPTPPPEPDAASAAPEPAQAGVTGDGAAALAPEALRRTVDGTTLGFKTTATLDPATGPLGQERALAALDFGLAMRAHDFNVFVCGPPGSGKSALVAAHLAKVAAASETPADWVYVTNFSDPRRPRALKLPPGRARALQAGLLAAVAELAATLPAAFGCEEYIARQRAIEQEHRASQEDALDDVHVRAAQQNIAILRTPLGFAMAPMHEGKVVKPDVFNQLPDSMRRDVETRITAAQAELEAILKQAPSADKARRRHLTALEHDIARDAVEEALDALSAAFADVPDVASFLADAEADLIARARQLASAEAAAGAVPLPAAEDPRWQRYLACIMVSQAGDAAGAPVCTLAAPSVAALVGCLAGASPTGAGSTLAIRPGALHHANGGALVVDARHLLAAPGAWDCLKRALMTSEIRIDADGPSPTSPDPAHAGAPAAPVLAPEPIPLTLKVVLLGEPDLFATLTETDPDFPRLFKVQAELNETIARSAETDAAYARLLAAMVARHDLKPIDSGGVARVMEEAARLAEDRDKLCIEPGRIVDILREADYWAEAEAREVISADDVARALKERTRRADRVRDHAHEAVARGVVALDTSGRRVGQLNALSLMQNGGFCFGRPARVTARVHVGQGRVTDIEREVALGGPLHSKGVLILWGYLAGRFAQDVPLALAATLGLEQSYDAVEGDSASAAELLALLSALAEVPLRQELAVTGSVDQWGAVQAVGGVNEKIEGFYDVCAARGLTGTQGVIIPDANRQHLMLREDVVAAVREKRFAVYAITGIDEGIALLTGLAAGQRGADGGFGAETVNGRVEARLRAYAETARGFASGPLAARSSQPQAGRT